MSLQSLDFVRVKSNHEFRGGLDGMVVDVDDETNTAALIFGYNRHPEMQYRHGAPVICEGPEAWSFDELDMESIGPRNVELN